MRRAQSIYLAVFTNAVHGDRLVDLASDRCPVWLTYYTAGRPQRMTALHPSMKKQRVATAESADLG